MLDQEDTLKSFSSKFLILRLVIAFLILVLLVRVGYLQLVKGNSYNVFSEQQILRREKQVGPRGRLLDRKGRVLVDNIQQLDLVATPQFVKNYQVAAQKLAGFFPQSQQKLEKLLRKKLIGMPPFVSITIFENLSWQQIVEFEKNQKLLPGFFIQTQHTRKHLYADMFAHVLGFVNEIDKATLKKMQEQEIPIEAGDKIGRSGIEKSYDNYLRGENGTKFIQVDSRGRIINKNKGSLDYVLSKKQRLQPAKSGNHIRLTLDLDLQKTAYEAMQGHMGAVVAIDPRNGAVRAMLSLPGFDPSSDNLLNKSLWRKLSIQKFGPLRNKAIHDHFPPGSTFKPFTMLAALENEIIDSKTVVNCPPSFRLGRRVYYDHSKQGYGWINYLLALRKSSNVFMFKMANKLTLDQITKTASMFGLGSRTGIGLDNEIPGLMPTFKWAEDQKRVWQKGETLSIAIGQGATLVTPLQMAVSYGALANNGEVYNPHLVDYVFKDKQSEPLFKTKPKIISRANVKPENLALIKTGLNSVVNDVGGTAYRLSTRERLFSGKTGTAQVIARTSKEDLFKKCMSKDLEKRHHGWFVGYGPGENPEIVVAVLLLHGCLSRNAAIVAGKVLNKWMEIRDQDQQAIAKNL